MNRSLKSAARRRFWIASTVGWALLLLYLFAPTVASAATLASSPSPTPSPSSTASTSPTATDSSSPSSSPSPTDSVSTSPSPSPSPSATAAPTIASNQADYAPGATVTLTGANWQGDTSVTIFVNDNIGNTWSYTTDVTVQPDGSISASFQLPTSFVASYSVKATGDQTGQTATATFTDSNVNIDQWANLSPAGWQNGDLNSSNSAYAENTVVPFRATITGMTPGTTHTIDLNYGFAHGSHEGYDFLATYNATEPATLCSGTGTGVSVMCPNLPTPATKAFPSDPTIPAFSPGLPVSGAQNAFLSGSNEALQLYGGTINSITAPSHTGGADDSATMTVSFTVPSSGPGCTPANNPNSCDVLLAWGGHLAASGYWNVSNGGSANGAALIRGAPFHMSAQNFDNGGGASQDRSLQPGAIVNPPMITTTAAPSSVIAGNPVTDTANLSGPSGPVNGTVKFFVCGPNGTNPDCTTGGTAVPLAGTPASISGGVATSQPFTPTAAGNYCFRAEYTPASGSPYIAQNETNTTTECFTVTPAQQAIHLAKSAAPTTYDHVGQVITYTYLITNTGNVTLGPAQFTVTDDHINGGAAFNCGPATTTLAPGGSVSCTATYSITQGDLDAGSVTNTATAHGAGQTSNQAQATVTANQTPKISIDKTTNGSDGLNIPVGAAITWKYHVTNTGNVTLTNVTVTDNKLPSSAINCGGGSNVVASFAVGASVDCTATGTAAAGAYSNIGTATGTPPTGSNVTAMDPSSYYGVQDLTIIKTATPTFTRTYSWSIAKAVDKTLVQQVGGSATFNYTVNVNQTGFSDSAWAMTGTITITNPNNFAVTLSGLTDVASAGTNCSLNTGGPYTVPKGGSLPVGYSCTSDGTAGTNVATATWDKSAYSTPDGSATKSVPYAFTTPTKRVYQTITVTDTFNNATNTLGTVTATDAQPFAAKTFTYSRTVPVPTFNCTSYTNTAKIVETGQSDSKTVQVCGPSNSGALTIGFWQNKNGQGIITGGASTGGVCNSGTWLRQFAPFQDLSATATCAQVAKYYITVFNAKSCSINNCIPMLKAQMLATALNVYFSDPALGGNKIGAFNGNGSNQSAIGSLKIDLSHICTMIDSSGGTASCGNSFYPLAAVQAVLGVGPSVTSMTVLDILNAVAARYTSPTSWYPTKAQNVLAKDIFDTINNEAAFIVP